MRPDLRRVAKAEKRLVDKEGSAAGMVHGPWYCLVLDVYP